MQDLEVFPPEQIKALALPVAKEKKKLKRIEKPIHKQAFAFYYSLGESRTLARVAQEFGVKESAVEAWSSSFNWKSKCLEICNRSKEDEFREKAMDLLVILLDSFSKRDEETGQLVLTAGEKSIVERLKLTIDAYKRLRDDSREQSDHDDGVNEHGSGPRKKSPVMVNVIFKGIDGN